jgi:hypothetical protein
MRLRQAINKKFRTILESRTIPEKFYCDKCGLLIMDKETTTLLEEQLRIYVCKCKN